MAAALTGEATDVEMMGTETVESMPLQDAVEDIRRAKT